MDWERAGWWWDNNKELVYIALIILIISLMLTAVFVSTAHNRETFMAECLKDHKQYECDSLWGAAQGGSTVIIPIYTGNR